MKNIREDIKNKNFKRVYLLYGEEIYLIKLYRDKLKAAVLDGGDDMNYSHFEDAITDISGIIESSDTMPFFADRRIIIVENSGLFKSSNELADYIPSIPETTVIVFAEHEIDKRNRLYKAVKENGYVCEFERLKLPELKQFAASQLNRYGMKITDSDCEYFINNVGSDMLLIVNELEKLAAYLGERKVVERKDIDAVCTVQITNRIFDMIDAIARKNRKLAFSLYFDLISLREKPLTILYLIIKHYNRLLLVYDMLQAHSSDSEIASKAGMPPWAVRNYRAQLQSFNRTKLIECLREGTELEEQIKTGQIDEQLGLELLIAKFTMN